MRFSFVLLCFCVCGFGVIGALQSSQVFGSKFDCRDIPVDKGWYTGGWETDAEGRLRVDRVVSWLKSLARPVEVVIMVTHTKRK